MIFSGGRLGFFYNSSYKKDLMYLKVVSFNFFHPENIGVDTNIISLWIIRTGYIAHIIISWRSF